MTITASQKQGQPCVFCNTPQIRDREIIAHNDLAWAFPTNIPITPFHTLVAPRRCVKNLKDLTKDERLAILELADSLMAAFIKIYAAEGFNCVWNEGVLAGQSVPHLHLHIIPRKDGDAGLLGYDPRSLLYRTGDRDPIPEDELLKVRDQIRAALKASTD